MTEAPSIESILVADCGTVSTKLLLIDRVADGYRFVAQAETQTTGRAPWNDLSVGVAQAVQELQTITGRRLFAQGRVVTPRHDLRRCRCICYHTRCSASFASSPGRSGR